MVTSFSAVTPRKLGGEGPERRPQSPTAASSYTRQPASGSRLPEACAAHAHYPPFPVPEAAKAKIQVPADSVSGEPLPGSQAAATAPMLRAPPRDSSPPRPHLRTVTLEIRLQATTG